MEKDIDEIYCSSCGKPIKKEAEICPHCGVRNKISFKPPKSKFPYKPVGIISAIISIGLFPIVFGILSVFCGYKVYSQESEGWGIGIMVLGAICLISGIIIGAYVGMNTF